MAAVGVPQYPKLKIVKATYGLKKENDITSLVQKMSEGQGGSLSILRKVEFNWSLGDPEPGADKILKLDYRYGEDGHMFHEEHPEQGHGDILLPKEDRPWDKLAGEMVLSIIRARNVPGWGPKLAAAVRWECCKHHDLYTKTADVTAKEPEWNQELSFKFANEVDAKYHCALSLVDKGLLSDTVLGKATLPLSHLTSNPDQQWVQLKHVPGRLPTTAAVSNDGPPAEVLIQAVWKGRAGPRKGAPGLNRMGSRLPGSPVSAGAGASPMAAAPSVPSAGTAAATANKSSY